MKQIKRTPFHFANCILNFGATRHIPVLRFHPSRGVVSSAPELRAAQRICSSLGGRGGEGGALCGLAVKQFVVSCVCARGESEREREGAAGCLAEAAREGEGGCAANKTARVRAAPSALAGSVSRGPWRRQPGGAPWPEWVTGERERTDAARSFKEGPAAPGLGWAGPSRARPLRPTTGEGGPAHTRTPAPAATTTRQVRGSLLRAGRRAESFENEVGRICVAGLLRSP